LQSLKIKFIFSIIFIVEVVCVGEFSLTPNEKSNGHSHEIWGLLSMLKFTKREWRQQPHRINTIEIYTILFSFKEIAILGCMKLNLTNIKSL
jgi:hypothetical protein